MRLEAPSLLAGTSACIQKRSGLVPTASVISFGLLICFGPFCRRRHGWMKRTALYVRPHGQDGSRPSFLFAGTLACIQKRSGLVPTVSVISFGLLICFGPFCCVDAQHSWTKWTALCIRPHGQDGFRASILVCGYFGMYTEGDWIGFSSVSPFVWV